jgi:hypothetical protein
MSFTTIRACRRRWPFRYMRAAELVLMASAAAGCGVSDGLDRQAISGTVTWEGQPLERGAILFEPATNESGTPVGSTIRAGNFAVARNQGPVPGLYFVRIYASSGTQASPTSGQTERTPRPMVERLPAAYNAQTELRASVIARGANQFRFELRARE